MMGCHRSVARELVQHVTSRHGQLRLADIAEPGPSCSSVSCAEAVRVALRLEQWLLETFSSAQKQASQVGDNIIVMILHQTPLITRRVTLLLTTCQHCWPGSWTRWRMLSCWSPRSSSARGKTRNTGWSPSTTRPRRLRTILQRHQVPGDH